MLRKRSQFWESLLFLFDIMLLCGAWILAYHLRFAGVLVPLVHDVPPLGVYLPPMVLFLPLWGWLYRGLELFRPRRRHSRLGEVLLVFKATTLLTLGLVSAGWIVFKLEPSRVMLAWFWGLSTVSLYSSRIVLREGWRYLNKRGTGARKVLIVGTDELAETIHARLRKHPELGLSSIGFLALDAASAPTSLRGKPVLGEARDLSRLCHEHGVGHVFVSLSTAVEQQLDEMLSEIDGELIEVDLVSGLYRHALNGGGIEDFDGLPIIHLDNEPMAGWSGVTKRLFDVVVSACLLVILSPVLGGVALVLLLRDGRPVFYVQQRMGLDGRTFTLLKFRTMRRDAEAGGAVWSQERDPRTTRFGRFLRRTSLDELPQLWNVFLGDMSLVGPRPERPVFVDEFRASIPSYMRRHRVKAGITGWAQINGLRGNTSVQDRLSYDLHYIRNWSLGLDVKILLRTAFGGFIDKNA